MGFPVLGEVEGFPASSDEDVPQSVVGDFSDSTNEDEEVQFLDLIEAALNDDNKVCTPSSMDSEMQPVVGVVKDSPTASNDEDFLTSPNEDLPTFNDEDFPAFTDEDFPTFSDEDFPAFSDEDFAALNDIDCSVA